VFRNNQVSQYVSDDENVVIVLLAVLSFDYKANFLLQTNEDQVGNSGGL
jgi:hypothetical protein